MNQVPLRERVANERRRLKAVRTALTDAVTRGAQGNAAWVPFYIAVADYIDASMHRLHIQDVRMGTMIRQKIGTIDAAAEKGLKELDERLAGNQRHLGLLLEAREALKREGAVALPRFEKVAGDYTAYIVSNMGHHGASTELAQRLFSLDDWSYMAGITEEETRTEQTLYERVSATAPAGITLAA